jgi:hypothetical protein
MADTEYPQKPRGKLRNMGLKSPFSSEADERQKFIGFYSYAYINFMRLELEPILRPPDRVDAAYWQNHSLQHVCGL